jgi:hypothetical protein
LEVTEHDYTLMRYLDDVVDGDAALLGGGTKMSART